jgi:hypothetical protein
MGWLEMKKEHTAKSKQKGETPSVRPAGLGQRLPGNITLTTKSQRSMSGGDYKRNCQKYQSQEDPWIGH